MNTPKKPRRRGALLLALLLALVCITAAELSAMSVFDPPLFHRLTDPVVQAGQTAWNAAKAAAAEIAGTTAACGRYLSQRLADFGGACAAWWEEITTPPPEDPPEDQSAGEPMLELGGLTQDPAVTQLEIRSGVELLTGGVVPVPYFCQGQEPWASRTYGSDPFSRYGCGPAVMAMAVSAMTEDYVDPDQMGQWAVQNGQWAKGSGSYLSLIPKAAEAWGLTAESLTDRTAEALQDALLGDHLLVALMGPGHFTKSGHFILLRGVTLSGGILVADPNSPDRSLVVWDPQLLLDELSGSTAHGAPLWVLSGGILASGSIE